MNETVLGNKVRNQVTHLKNKVVTSFYSDSLPGLSQKVLCSIHAYVRELEVPIQKLSY